MYDSSTRGVRGAYNKRLTGYLRTVEIAEESKRIHIKEVRGSIVLVADKKDLVAASPWLIERMAGCKSKLDYIQRKLVEKYDASTKAKLKLVSDS